MSIGNKLNIDNLIKRTAIKFCIKAALYAKNQFEMLQKAYGESCLKKIAFYQWVWSVSGRSGKCG